MEALEKGLSGITAPVDGCRSRGAPVTPFVPVDKKAILRGKHLLMLDQYSIGFHRRSESRIRNRVRLIIQSTKRTQFTLPGGSCPFQ
jgi:hypothetical protein